MGARSRQHLAERDGRVDPPGGSGNTGPGGQIVQAVFKRASCMNREEDSSDSSIPKQIARRSTARARFLSVEGAPSEYI
eukprot:3824731-Pyramimonas_sp.AAC.1